MGNMCRSLVGRSGREKPLGRPDSRLEGNNKTDIRKIQYEFLD
jgi:hypothetical protein